MARWTHRQEQILRDYGYLGVDEIRLKLKRECGAEHSRHAIEVHAARIHASLKISETCPECGAVGVTLNRRSGMCAVCTEMQHIREGMAFEEVLLRECQIAATGADKVEEAKRDRAKMRQRHKRICEKYGLPNLRQHRRGQDGCRCPDCEFWPDCPGAADDG